MELGLHFESVLMYSHRLGGEKTGVCTQVKVLMWKIYKKYKMLKCRGRVTQNNKVITRIHLFDQFQPFEDTGAHPLTREGSGCTGDDPSPCSNSLLKNVPEMKSQQKHRPAVSAGEGPPRTEQQTQQSGGKTSLLTASITASTTVCNVKVTQCNHFPVLGFFSERGL